jgi:cysteinyl-tRNA synthetase
MHPITLTNTLTGQKELFTPRDASNAVSMYVCGVTPYDYAHIGHGRCYVVFDVLYRLLQHVGYKVTYCRNFTDIDDKLLARAQRELGDPLRYREVAEKYIAAYQEDMRRLNCLTPPCEPRVTETIPEIITFIDHLVKKGAAYAVNGSVYFAVRAHKNYGKLSKRSLDEMQAGARVDINDEKRDPMDFALWKHEDEHGFWDSPWGHGRPGWHIECSVMSKKHLGDIIDIHGGGMDLIFPHHENEVAQSEAFHGHEYVRFWLHNAFVRINQEKMSKSLGNFFTLRDVFEKYDPMVMRYMLISHHYRSPLDFSFDDLDVAGKTYQRVCKFFAQDAGIKQPACTSVQTDVIVAKMLDFLCDDLNMPGMLGVLFESMPHLQQPQASRWAVATFLKQVMGLTLEPLPEKEVEMTPEIQALVAEREQARINRDWKKSDELRDQLSKLGYTVQDKKIG